MMDSEPWWRGIGNNQSSVAGAGGNVSNSSSLKCPNGSESNDVHKDDDETNKDSQATASSQSVENSGEHQNLSRLSSTVPASHDEYLTQPPQLELVGHSIACTSTPYLDPYYAGMMGVYGQQPLGCLPYVGIPHARMPLPPEIAQEPVYVNAKQYQGILRRRQARAKAELEKKLIKSKKPYLHESRHQHAMRRQRGSGGRFTKKTDVEASQQPSSEEKGTDCGTFRSYMSQSSSGSDTVPTDSAETWNFSANRHEANNLQTSACNINLNERREDKDCAAQQWSNISSNQTSQQRLTIQ